MRITIGAALALAACFECSAAEAPKDPVMVELMVKSIQANSDPIFYIGNNTPKNDAEWADLLQKANALAAAAKKLTAAPLARDQGQWAKDAKLLVDAAATAVAAVKKKDTKALEELNDPLYSACESCHEHYRGH